MTTSRFEFCRSKYIRNKLLSNSNRKCLGHSFPMSFSENCTLLLNHTLGWISRLINTLKLWTQLSVNQLSKHDIITLTILLCKEIDCNVITYYTAHSMHEVMEIYIVFFFSPILGNILDTATNFPAEPCIQNAMI